MSNQNTVEKTIVEEFEIRATDSTLLKGELLGNPADSRAIIILVHGIGEHYKRYNYVADMLINQGFYVVRFDQRGHGLSEGKRGHTPSAKQLMEDISTVILLARQKNSTLPIFLYGHSLGALEVLYYCLTEKPELKGVIATSPPLDLSTTPESKKKLAKFLNPILPGLVMPSGLDTKALSRDTKVVEAYIHDPLVHDKVSVRMGAFLFDGAQFVLDNAGNWTLPLYLAHGTEDHICGIKGTDAFFEKASGPITYKRWEGLYHETHNEPEKDMVLTTKIDWMKHNLS